MLKNILSLLLSKFYSKQESEAVGHQAMPELSQYIDLTSNATTNVENTYVAPTDGYFVCATKGGEWSGVNVWGTLDAGAPGASGIQGKVFTPCVKGASVHYIIYGTIHLVRFYKTIGGVQTLKNALLQGGAICLSNLCNSLRRSSWLARRRAFRTGRTPTSQIVSPFSFHLQKTVLFIHPQATDGCRCTLGTRGLLTSRLILMQRIIAQSCLAFCLPLPVGTATFIEYVKALMSGSTLQILYRKDGLCFFRLTNSAVGGASC